MENTYMILEEKREEVAKKLRRLQKKAQKYNVPFTVTESEPYCHTVIRDYDGRKVEERYEVYDLTIVSEVIKNDGYSIIARIEHCDDGNIVNVFDGEMQMEWAKIPAHCDHCNGNHHQKITVIVEKDGVQKQVGRTCLKEYCGIDPQTIGMFNQFFDDIEEYTMEGYDFDESIPHVYDTDTVLAHAIAVLRAQGYRKTDERDSNRDAVLKLTLDGERPTEEDLNKAKEMSAYIENMSIEDAVNARLDNVRTRIKGYYCKPSDFGYFAFAPLAYENMMKRIAKQKERDAERKAMSEASEYVGTIGERTVFNVKEAKLLTSWENQYGMTFLYRFIDENDNVLVWFASTTIDEDVAKIKATVKDHSERDGVKQTIITRVKVA